MNFIKNRSIDELLKLGFFCLITISVLQIDHIFSNSRSSFAVLDQYGGSLIIRKSGNELGIYTSAENRTAQIEKAIDNFSLKYLDLKRERMASIRHFYTFQNKRIMVIDHECIQSDLGFEPDILVLINSPRINLNRLLMKVKPSVIIADGSNYPTYKSLWIKSAKLAGILFHDTSKDGAFMLSETS